MHVCTHGLFYFGFNIHLSFSFFSPSLYITSSPSPLLSSNQIHLFISLFLFLNHSLSNHSNKKKQFLYKIKNGKQSTSDIKESVEYGTCSLLHVEKRHVKGQTNDGPKHDAQTPQQARRKSHCQPNVPPSPQPRWLHLKPLSPIYSIKGV